MVLPQVMAWVQYWFCVLSLKFCGKFKKNCGDISQLSPAFCMYDHDLRFFVPRGSVQKYLTKAAWILFITTNYYRNTPKRPSILNKSFLSKKLIFDIVPRGTSLLADIGEEKGPFLDKKGNFYLLWSSWDIEFSLLRHHLFALRAMRFPFQSQFKCVALRWKEWLLC